MFGARARPCPSKATFALAFRRVVPRMLDNILGRPECAALLNAVDLSRHFYQLAHRILDGSASSRDSALVADAKSIQEKIASEIDAYGLRLLTEHERSVIDEHNDVDDR